MELLYLIRKMSFLNSVLRLKHLKSLFLSVISQVYPITKVLTLNCF